MAGMTGWRAAAVAASMMAGCAGGEAPEAPQGDDPYAVQVAQPGAATCTATSARQNFAAAAATNAPRTGQGLPPLNASPLLARVAADHACDMARRGRMTHLGSTTSGPGDRLRANGYHPRISAENIAAGPFSQERVLQEWVLSKGHRDNILLPQVQDYGIGHAYGADGRTVYWAAVYAAPGGRPRR